MGFVVSVRRFSTEDLGWVEALLDDVLGGRWQARLGELIDVLSFDGLVAVEGNGLGVGFVGFRCYDAECELMAIAARQRQGGVGTARGGGEWSRSGVRGVPLPRRGM
jgi:hypothetical protein